jgi:chitin disaccharide deacetylase
VCAHREGIVTSASLMVRGPAAQDAVSRAGKLDLGLHLDLGEWVFRDGEWVALYERASLEDSKAVEAEARSQLQEFQRLTGQMPTHIDSHQHVHMHEPVLFVAKRMAQQLLAPLRGCTPNIRYCGWFYGQSGKGEPCPEAISVPSLIALLARLPAGITELGCHPGEDGELASTYVRERALEVEVLCDPRVREAVVRQNIRLARFVDPQGGEP